MHLLSFLFLFPFIVQTKLFTPSCANNGTCYYNNPDSWQNKIIPGSGDDVYIYSTSFLTVVLENCDALVKSISVSYLVTFIVSNATLTTPSFSCNEVYIINGSNVNCTQNFAAGNISVSGSNLTTKRATIQGSATFIESNVSCLSLSSKNLSLHNSFVFCHTLYPSTLYATGERTKLEVNTFSVKNARLENISNFTNLASVDVTESFFITTCNHVNISTLNLQRGATMEYNSNNYKQFLIDEIDSNPFFDTTIILRGQTFLAVSETYGVNWIFDGLTTLHVGVMGIFEKIQQTPYSTVSIMGEGYFIFNKESTLHGNLNLSSINEDKWPTLSIYAPLSIYNDQSCILGSAATFLYASLSCNSNISVRSMAFYPGVNVSAKNIAISNYLQTELTTITGNVYVDEHLQIIGNTFINGDFLVKSSLRIYPSVDLSQSIITATGDISLINVDTSLEFFFDIEYENGKKIILAETVNGKIQADIASLSNRNGTRLTHYQQDKKLFVVQQNVTKYFVIMAIVSVSLVFGMFLYYYVVWRRFLSNVSPRLSQ